MITYIKRKDLNLEKYDFCIQNSIQSRIYAFSWYLDIVADNWDVLVLDDYKAVMPIPWKSKYGFKYVYPPFWLLELGFFSLEENDNLTSFLKVLTRKFKFIESRLNTSNFKFVSVDFLIKKEVQELSLINDYELIKNNYRKDRRKDLNKALKNDLTEKWNDDVDDLITLFRNNIGKRTKNIIDKDYATLKKIIETCLEKKVGEILSVYDSENHLVASGFFLKHNKTVTLLISSTDLKNRKNGPNTFLIDRAIYKYTKNYKYFNFGGSSMESIAKYFLSFGGISKSYYFLKFNRLPTLLKIFKN